uniref:Uncharacterized protein n=1 Tax=Steinernema glaseri TaxID=37863 RepID=A0A1I7ZI04_9BILA
MSHLEAEKVCSNARISESHPDNELTMQVQSVKGPLLTAAGLVASQSPGEVRDARPGMTPLSSLFSTSATSKPNIPLNLITMRKKYKKFFTFAPCIPRERGDSRLTFWTVCLTNYE